ncbi:uncharacterized protein An16g03160 [Aspergillus niger]|uniref:Contig An16c0110, genomic contig n=2 Tax=Aspergillus niger TaxID=5061 RepID=A2R7D6_ASPNC|nr:uncharacterized protein An16g03160 [Aspergillus niger]CAK42814.1 unnamed protein product [Aspergillus niger]
MVRKGRLPITQATTCGFQVDPNHVTDCLACLSSSAESTDGVTKTPLARTADSRLIRKADTQSRSLRASSVRKLWNQSQ